MTNPLDQFPSEFGPPPPVARNAGLLGRFDPTNPRDVNNLLDQLTLIHEYLVDNYDVCDVPDGEGVRPNTAMSLGVNLAALLCSMGHPVE